MVISAVSGATTSLPSQHLPSIFENEPISAFHELSFRRNSTGFFFAPVKTAEQLHPAYIGRPWRRLFYTFVCRRFFVRSAFPYQETEVCAQRKEALGEREGRQWVYGYRRDSIALRAERVRLIVSLMGWVKSARVLCPKRTVLTFFVPTVARIVLTPTVGFNDERPCPIQLAPFAASVSIQR